MKRTRQKRVTRNTKPLSGERVLITRARGQAEGLAAALRAQGARVVSVPVIEIRPPRSYAPLDQALKRLPRYDWLILTSVNGVDALCARLRKLRRESARPAGLRVAAIGPATRAALEARGWRVDLMPRQYVAEAVVRSLRGRAAGRRVLLVRAEVARDVIPRELRRAGARVDVVAAYRTAQPQVAARRLRSLLRDPRRRPTVITFTSSSTARNLAAILGREDLYSGRLDGIRLASIGPVTSHTLRELGLPPDIEARRYTTDGLVKAILRCLSH